LQYEKRTNKIKEKGHWLKDLFSLLPFLTRKKKKMLTVIFFTFLMQILKTNKRNHKKRKKNIAHNDRFSCFFCKCGKCHKLNFTLIEKQRDTRKMKIGWLCSFSVLPYSGNDCTLVRVTTGKIAGQLNSWRVRVYDRKIVFRVSFSSKKQEKPSQ